MAQALAIKYRPKCWEDLTEQVGVVAILDNQIATNTIKHGYLFCGGAGTGKTTSARIFANKINNGRGEPIELDAASNNSVDDIRRITEQATKKSLDSEYKVFILDEVHVLSNQAWQAMLKTLEEPPAKSIFILCTTNPEKIPATILSRVQRYNFQRISHEGIVNRLNTILQSEAVENPEISWSPEAVEYIAKIADGGMRDAITLVDKCLSYSKDLTEKNVISALGVVDYSTMFDLIEIFHNKDIELCLKSINNIYSSGMDLKLFIKDFFEFILDVNVALTLKSLDFTKLPSIWESTISAFGSDYKSVIFNMLSMLNELQSSIKWEQNPKAVISAKFILFLSEV